MLRFRRIGSDGLYLQATDRDGKFEFEHLPYSGLRRDDTILRWRHPEKGLFRARGGP